MKNSCTNVFFAFYRTYIIDAKTSVEYTSMNVVTTTGQNLSMILELSKERSSCSSGGNSETGYAITSKTSVIPDKNHLCAINETDENESSKPHSHVVPDPFNTELIQSLLGKIKISLTDGSNEFYPINSDMPLIKQSSTVKLGKSSVMLIFMIKNIINCFINLLCVQVMKNCPW